MLVFGHSSQCRCYRYFSRHLVIFNQLLRNLACVLGIPSVTYALSFDATVLPHMQRMAEQCKTFEVPLVVTIHQKVPLDRSGKARYSHFLKLGSKVLIFGFSMILIEKSELLYDTNCDLIAHFVLALKRTVKTKSGRSMWFHTM